MYDVSFSSQVEAFDGPHHHAALAEWSPDPESPAARPPEPTAWIRALLDSLSAINTTNERTTMRVIYWARMAGMTQREVADSLHRPQTHVFRQLQQIDADPSAIAMTPRELYDHYRAGGIDRRRLLALLAAYPYERGSFPAESRDWGYVAGSYDQLVQLAAEGLLSDDELDVVLAGVEAMAGQNG